MAFSNDEGASVNGISQVFLINYLIFIHGIIDGLMVKLDADAGTGLDVNYAAALRDSLPVAAAPTLGISDVATISAAVAAFS